MGQFAPTPRPGLTLDSLRTQGSASLHPGLRSYAASRLKCSGLEGSKLKVSKPTVLGLAGASRQVALPAHEPRSRGFAFPRPVVLRLVLDPAPPRPTARFDGLLAKAGRRAANRRTHNLKPPGKARSPPRLTRRPVRVHPVCPDTRPAQRSSASSHSPAVSSPPPRQIRG